MTRFVPIDRLINITDGYRRVVNLGGASYLYLHEGGRHHLLLNQCPHRGLPLAESTVVDGVLRCPHHGMSFELDTGRCLEDGSGCSGLNRYQLHFEDQYIGFLLNED